MQLFRREDVKLGRWTGQCARTLTPQQPHINTSRRWTRRNSSSSRASMALKQLAVLSRPRNRLLKERSGQGWDMWQHSESGPWRHWCSKKKKGKNYHYPLKCYSVIVIVLHILLFIIIHIIIPGHNLTRATWCRNQFGFVCPCANVESVVIITVVWLALFELWN